MKTLRHLPYVGTPHTRRIEAKDLAAVGVEDQTDAVSWNPGNDHETEVSDATADWLMKNEKGDWRVVSTGDGASSSGAESAEDDDETLDDSSASSSTSKRTRRT